MAEVAVPGDRRTLVGHYLTEMGLYAKAISRDSEGSPAFGNIAWSWAIRSLARLQWIHEGF